MADPIAFQEVAAFIGQVGFPVVAFYLMYNMAKETIKENTETLVQVRLTLEKISTKLEDKNSL
jgi:hypothetical protein